MRQHNQTQLRVDRGKRSTTNKAPAIAPGKSRGLETRRTKRRPVSKMVLFGALSMASYFLLFSNEQLVTQTYTLGGWYAAFPVLTAFLFSFVHGAFASNLLSVLGIEAKKTVTS